MVIVSTKEQGKNVWNSIENLDGSVLSQFAFHFFSGSVQLGWKRGQDKKLSWTNFGTSVKQQLTHSSFIIRDFPLAGRQKDPFIGIFLKQVYTRQPVISDIDIIQKLHDHLSHPEDIKSFPHYHVLWSESSRTSSTSSGLGESSVSGSVFPDFLGGSSSMSTCSIASSW